MNPKVLVLSGYGLNGEQEMRQGFVLAGAEVEIVHINDIIEGQRSLDEFQVLAIPGGFSYGDHTGAGKAFANRVLNNFGDDLLKFIQRDTLTFGICNGFQILVQLGILPAMNGEYGKRQAALIHNASQRYQCEWIRVKVQPTNCVFTRGLEFLDLPIGHGEGRFYMPEADLDALLDRKQVALTYQDYNPNGAFKDIAGVTDPSGRIFGLMPHPDRSLYFTNRPDWIQRKIELEKSGQEVPEFGPGLAIYQNAVSYFTQS
jgi:phosphoribosylformylglycinamidine synthase I